MNLVQHIVSSPPYSNINWRFKKCLPVICNSLFIFTYKKIILANVPCDLENKVSCLLYSNFEIYWINDPLNFIMDIFHMFTLLLSDFFKDWNTSFLITLSITFYLFDLSYLYKLYVLLFMYFNFKTLLRFSFLKNIYFLF